MPVPARDLPVELPNDVSFEGSGNPLDLIKHDLVASPVVESWQARSSCLLANLALPIAEREVRVPSRATVLIFFIRRP